MLIKQIKLFKPAFGINDVQRKKPVRSRNKPLLNSTVEPRVTQTLKGNEKQFDLAGVRGVDQTKHVLSTMFSWRPFSSFSLCIILLPPSPPLILPLLNQCDGCLVLLAWGLMAWGRMFASHGGVTLSRGWLCQRWNWKPLDIHLHSVTQLLTEGFLRYRFGGLIHGGAYFQNFMVT